MHTHLCVIKPTVCDVLANRCSYIQCLLCTIILTNLINYSPLQRNVQHWHPFQTELLHMVLIQLLLLMWEQWLLIAVMMVSRWVPDLRFERV